MLKLERLKELLRYDPTTGHFTWLVSGGSLAPAGSIAGTRTKIGGYRVITIDRVQYKAHRLAWFAVHEAWPTGHIDHANGDTDDNRAANLRLATASQNCQNQRRSRNNKSGAKGVYWDKKRQRWTASIAVNGVRRFLGEFASVNDASEAYNAAAKDLCGEFARPHETIDRAYSPPSGPKRLRMSPEQKRERRKEWNRRYCERHPERRKTSWQRANALKRERQQCQSQK